MMAAQAVGSVVPAQLGFLAIFNPSFGDSDDTLDDQILYYSSITTSSSLRKKRHSRGRATDGISQEERNERLRQIGLAQGMINFSRGFADGAAIDSIETEKSRVVVHELESGWWIIASIDITRLPLPPRLPVKTGEKAEERYEFSTREMKPASLILKDLLRAYNVFLLHHDSSLTSLFMRVKRPKFVAMMSRYWDLFLSTWNVMLHGNPAREVLAGINVAASGELGVGVGEEDRGSGEREVLEGLVGRVEGLVDLVVSKFGEEDDYMTSQGTSAAQNEPSASWLGSGKEPSASDGVIFLGSGGITRNSLKNITHWMEDLYTWGEHAYGVIDSPASTRKAKARTDLKTAAQKPDESTSLEQPKAVTENTDQPSDATQQAKTATIDQPKEAEDGKLDKMVGYLKLGYGSYWTLPGASSLGQTGSPVVSKGKDSGGVTKSIEERPEPKRKPSRQTPIDESAGHYLIGLKGDIEKTDEGVEQDASEFSDDSGVDSNTRTVLRTVNVELQVDSDEQNDDTPLDDLPTQQQISSRATFAGGRQLLDAGRTEKLRVVVYVNKPFMFVFLFRLRTDSLAWDSLYRSLHYQLAPLRKPLLASTRYRPERPDAASSRPSSSGNSSGIRSGIYDLIWNPEDLTVHSNIPNIPAYQAEPGVFSSSQQQQQDLWSRADAVSTHLHILNIYNATRSPSTVDLERTQKTSRGWWIVWTRLIQRRMESRTASVQPSRPSTPPSPAPAFGYAQRTGKDYGRVGVEEEEDQMRDTAKIDDAPPPLQDQTANLTSKEVFLVRRAGDHSSAGSSITSSSATGIEAAGKLAQGIGVDTRRYIEDLLSML